MMIKFGFTTEFQYDLLKYTVLDRDGYKALELYNDSYFSLTEHAVIAFTLKRFYKKKRKIPGQTILIEELHGVFELKEFTNNLTDADRKDILGITNSFYKGNVKDGDEILEKAEKFAQFVDLKHEVESVNLLDYAQYDEFSKKIQKAISSRIKKEEEKGAFLFSDYRMRQLQRQEKSPMHPFPWSQLNKLTNAGGYVKGSIFVILDRAKKFKTGMLVNLARSYATAGETVGGRKVVLVVDLENGEDEYALRIEQSFVRGTKVEILDGEHDKRLGYKFRALKRWGGEIIIKRMPALVTTAAHIGDYIDFLYREFGIRVEVLIIDFMGKMGCISGKESLHERIGEAYIDVDNLAAEKDIIHVWTAQHVTRDAAREREGTCYFGTDVAGAIDITRSASAIFGLNRTPAEEEQGVQRFEIVDQRDGIHTGRVVFMIDQEKQSLTPLNKAQKDEFDIQFAKQEEDKKRGSDI